MFSLWGAGQHEMCFQNVLVKYNCPFCRLKHLHRLRYWYVLRGKRYLYKYYSCSSGAAPQTGSSSLKLSALCRCSSLVPGFLLVLPLPASIHQLTRKQAWQTVTYWATQIMQVLFPCSWQVQPRASNVQQARTPSVQVSNSLQTLRIATHLPYIFICSCGAKWLHRRHLFYVADSNVALYGTTRDKVNHVGLFCQIRKSWAVTSRVDHHSAFALIS